MPAVVAVELIVHALQIVEIPDVLGSEVCLSNIHVLWRQFCQLQCGAGFSHQHHERWACVMTAHMQRDAPRRDPATAHSALPCHSCAGTNVAVQSPA